MSSSPRSSLQTVTVNAAKIAGAFLSIIIASSNFGGMGNLIDVCDEYKNSKISSGQFFAELIFSAVAILTTTIYVHRNLAAKKTQQVSQVTANEGLRKTLQPITKLVSYVAVLATATAAFAGVFSGVHSGVTLIKDYASGKASELKFFLALAITLPVPFVLYSSYDKFFKEVKQTTNNLEKSLLQYDDQEDRGELLFNP
jgi:hypothetical protein